MPDDLIHNKLLNIYIRCNITRLFHNYHLLLATMLII